MDRKSIIILAVAVGLYFLLSPVVDHFFPPRPAPIMPPAATNSAMAATNARAAAVSPFAHVPAAPATTLSAPEQIVTVSNADLIWHFTSRGGGLKDVDLAHYPALIRRGADPASETNLASLNRNAPLPVLALMGRDLDGDAISR
jgi:YidC/Oxa1 family membrane protein insertase